MDDEDLVPVLLTVIIAGGLHYLTGKHGLAWPCKKEAIFTSAAENIYLVMIG